MRLDGYKVTNTLMMPATVDELKTHDVTVKQSTALWPNCDHFFMSQDTQVPLANSHI
jgi:hypothetical protein